MGKVILKRPAFNGIALVPSGKPVSWPEETSLPSGAVKIQPEEDKKPASSKGEKAK